MKPNHAGHYEVEGVPFKGFKNVAAVARTMGYVGGDKVIYNRLRAGDRTWDRLCRPIGENKLNAARKAKRDASRQEMAQLCAEIDARKKLLQEAGQ